VRKLQPLKAGGAVFTKISQSNSSYPIFEPLKKSLKDYSDAFRAKR
jgi:hypothetical protein